MEEKKKRVRPTLTQMRKLEKELEKVNEDCEKHSLTIVSLMAQIKGLKEKNNTLEMSNRLLEEEIERLRYRNRSLLARVIKNTEQIFLLKNRKFWARVFNRRILEDVYEE